MALIVSALIGFLYVQTGRTHTIASLEPELDAWIEDLAAPHHQRFDEIGAMISTARLAYLEASSRLPEAPRAAFDQAFPEFGDGTRRSHPALFDGFETEAGEWVYGIGAYLGDAEAMTPEQARWFWLGYDTVRRLGPDSVGMDSSLYYFTPDRRAVLFAPGRDDRLEFYRLTAPADFNMRGDEDYILFGAETNPDRALQCTKISRLLSEDEGERTGMACRIPLWANDVLMGAIGTTFDVTALLDASARTSPHGGSVWLLDHEAAIITRQSHEAYHAPGRSMDDMLARIPDARMGGVFRMENSLVAYRRIPHADWLLITCVEIGPILAPLVWRGMFLAFALFILLSLAAALKTGLVTRLLPPFRTPGQRPAE